MSARPCRAHQDVCTSADQPPREHYGLEPGIVGREARLERLVPSPEAVLPRPLRDRGADRVGHEDEADRVAIECRVAAGLVVAARRTHLEAVPGGDRAAVELEQPEPQPAAPERFPGELSVERRVAEVGRRRAPARAVEREQRVEISVEGPLVREARHHGALALEAGLTAPELLAEIRAASREILVPAPGEPERRARLASPGTACEQLGPRLVAGQLLAEEDVPVQPVESGAERAGRCVVLAPGVDGAELVAGAVAEEADHARQTAAPGVQREDDGERAVGRARGVEKELTVAAVVLPPDPAPERRREDAAGALRESVPLALERAESGDELRARYFRRLAMSDVLPHSSLAKRVVRPVARIVGVPVGVGFMLLLRLTGRKAGVALMYHSVDRRAGDPARELVPPHEARLFESQLRHVVRHYDVVRADQLLEAVAARRRGQRFPVAITFDDDLASHVLIAAPVLRRLGVTATFFLSGASLDRPFSFHFERLQRAWDAGVQDLPIVVAGTPVAPTSLHALGVAMVEMSPADRDRAAERLLAEAGRDPEDAGLRREQVRELVASGMTVGFHTYRHDPLTGLTDDELEAAMRRGRDELAEATGAPVDLIGYPHGRADERVAEAARAAGYRFGYCTRRLPVTPASNPWLLGRFGPSLRSAGALALELAFTLVKRESGRPSPARERAPS
jgi:peptidoglycan/xylan/chitin deacetylase (PgdA/CDA1 family)